MLLGFVIIIEFCILYANALAIGYVRLCIRYLSSVRNYYHLLGNLWFLLLYEWFFVHDYVMYNSVCTSVTTWFLCAYQCLCTQ